MPPLPRRNNSQSPAIDGPGFGDPTPTLWHFMAAKPVLPTNGAPNRSKIAHCRQALLQGKRCREGAPDRPVDGGAGKPAVNPLGCLQPRWPKRHRRAAVRRSNDCAVALYFGHASAPKERSTQPNPIVVPGGGPTMARRRKRRC